MNKEEIARATREYAEIIQFQCWLLDRKRKYLESLHRAPEPRWYAYRDNFNLLMDALVEWKMELLFKLTPLEV